MVSSWFPYGFHMVSILQCFCFMLRILPWKKASLNLWRRGSKPPPPSSRTRRRTSLRMRTGPKIPPLHWQSSIKLAAVSMIQSKRIKVTWRVVWYRLIISNNGLDLLMCNSWFCSNLHVLGEKNVSSWLWHVSPRHALVMQGISLLLLLLQSKEKGNLFFACTLQMS